MAYQLPKLNYSYDALQPYIDARTMEIHHTKHHNAYITNLNTALESLSYQAPSDISDLIKDLSKVPDAIRTTVRNNAGGHANHAFFWNILTNKSSKKPLGQLASAIDNELGGFDKFKEDFKKTALSRFGSGWAWLSLKKDGKLAISSTPNQDSPLMHGIAESEGTPLLGLDVWEHAYYLNYQNRRADYIDAFWNIIDWDAVNNHYLKAS